MNGFPNNLGKMYGCVVEHACVYEFVWHFIVCHRNLYLPFALGWKIFKPCLWTNFPLIKPNSLMGIMEMLYYTVIMGVYYY